MATKKKIDGKTKAKTTKTKFLSPGDPSKSPGKSEKQDNHKNAPEGAAPASIR